MSPSIYGSRWTSHVVRPIHQGECGVTRNPWNEAEARWVYDSNANSVEDQGANRSGDKKKHGAAASVGRPGLLSLFERIDDMWITQGGEPEHE